MKIRTKTTPLRTTAFCASCTLASVWMSGTAFAQAAATPPAPPTPPGAPPASPPTTPTPPNTPSAPPETQAGVPATPAAAAPVPTPPTTEPAAPAPPPPLAEVPPPEPPKPEEKKLKPIDVGAWLRVGMAFQGSSDPKKLNDQHFDTAYGELHASGQVHEKVGWTLNLNVNALAQSANMMDAIIELDFLDEFHVHAGQLLVPVDRTNFSGPFFTSPWTYPGIFSVGGTTVAATPAEGPSGRNTGAVIWGDFEKGLFKYYAGMMNLSNVSQSPLFSGRLNFAPIGKEPGYYSASTYYGSKDVLAIGVGAQYRKDGSTGTAPVDAMGNATGPAPTAHFSEVNADLLAEFSLGPNSGTLTGEGAYYHFGGDFEKTNNMFFLTGSYLTPKVGPGALQPMVRYQRAWKGDEKVSMIEGHVAYVVDGAKLRGLIGFRHTDLGGDVIGNAIEIGLQTIQF